MFQDCENVVQLLGEVTLPLTTTSVLLLDYFPYSLLDLYRGKAKRQKFAELDLHGKEIAESIASALVQIAKFNIVHLDIKPANVLVGC